MKIHNEKQGSAEWLVLRLNHFTASEAPAMMGASKYQSRNELLKLKKTGLSPEVDEFTQKNFDRGHAAEAMARPIIEKMIGEELYPVVGSKGNMLASMDGLTMMGETLFEHKLWNAELVKQVEAKELSEHYYWQLEQQLLVSGAERVIFVCSDGTEENMVHMEYQPVEGRADQLVAGWAQFEKDLEDFEVSEANQVEAVGRTPETLPALRIEVTGMVTSSNLAAFKDHALSVIGSINRNLVTDQDFADAEKTIKWCHDVESRLKAAKEHALSQTASIDELFKALDDIGAEARSTRLSLNKLVTAMKDNRRAEIFNAATEALNEHLASVNKQLGSCAISTYKADFAGAMKGKRTIATLQDAADTELARAKIEINSMSSAILDNLAAYKEHAAEFEFLFPDLPEIINRPLADFEALIRLRIVDHKEAEQKRLDAERERIRAEEQARAEREAQAKAEAEERAIRDNAARAADAALTVKAVETAKQECSKPRTGEQEPVIKKEANAGQGGTTHESVTISKAEYDDLLSAKALLDALEEAGVEGWSGYALAMDMVKAA